MMTDFLYVFLVVVILLKIVLALRRRPSVVASLLNDLLSALNFISMPLSLIRKLLSLGISNLLSIGCGCAFLEWLLNQATRIKVSAGKKPHL